MGAVMRYVKQEKKTHWGDRQLVSGINCRPESVYDDFLRTKLLYHKEDGRMFYHMVQSFPAGEPVGPAAAHAAALKLAEYFEGREVLVCTHTDRDHIHSHFIINSVSLEDGRKLHISEPELSELRQRNDAVCAQFGLPVFQPERPKKTKAVASAEYHAAARGESWKFQMMNYIDECMRYARTRDEFVLLMRSEGYDVRWQDTRKNITYTTPDGKKCRDDRLHDEKYLKENMENEFRIREEFIAGGTAPAEHAAASSAVGMAPDSRGVGQPAGTGQCSIQSDSGAIQSHHQTAGEFHPGTDCGADPGSCGHRKSHYNSGSANPGEYPTGWEKERTALFAPAYQPAPPQLGMAGIPGDLGGIGRAVVQLGHHFEGIGDVAPSYTARPHTDRKARQRERELKIAHGHAEDDHEEYQGPNLSM